MDKKKKEIITDYRKRMEKLNDAVFRTRSHFLSQIKKQTIGDLVRMGEDEFEALNILEDINNFSLTCHKCGSAVKCVKC